MKTVHRTKHAAVLSQSCTSSQVPSALKIAGVCGPLCNAVFKAGSSGGGGGPDVGRTTLQVHGGVAAMQEGGWGGKGAAHAWMKGSLSSLMTEPRSYTAWSPSRNMHCSPAAVGMSTASSLKSYFPCPPPPPPPARRQLVQDHRLTRPSETLASAAPCVPRGSCCTCR